MFVPVLLRNREATFCLVIVTNDLHAKPRLLAFDFADNLLHIYFELKDNLLSL